MKWRVAILKPTGAVHADCFLELAETLHHGLVALGYESSWGFNELDPDATNLILGWHLSPDLRFPAGSVVLNLEQFGEMTQGMAERFLRLQNRYVLWDYSQRNIDLLRRLGCVAPIQLLRIGNMPPMTRIQNATAPDIDVLFYGSINDRRKDVLVELSQRGLVVKHLFGVYGAERDALIARAKVVLNMHYYSANIFESVRVSYLLANAKAVVAECDAECEVEPEIANAVKAVPYDRLVESCVELCENPVQRNLFAYLGIRTMTRRKQCDFLADLLATIREPAPPCRINLGSGKDWRPDYLNLDMSPQWHPDVVADITQPWQTHRISPTFGIVEMKPGAYREIVANDVLEHLPKLPQAMTACLELLQDGGVFNIQVPYDLSLGAWQDPTHVRAFNEMSWAYYTEWWWYLGWTTHRFDVTRQELLLSDYGNTLEGKTQAELLRTPRAVDALKVTLQKRALSVGEKLLGERLRGEPAPPLPDARGVPVFIINRDRLDTLRKLVDWLRVCGMLDITVLDNASTYPPLIDYYKAETLDVRYLSNRGPWHLWQDPELLRDVQGPYIVTDADLDPTGCPLDLPAQLLGLITRFPEAQKIGVGLRLDDIPARYRHRDQVLQWEAQFWQSTAGPDLFYAPVDTTFAIYGTKQFSNGVHNLRMNTPYVMRHAPWYVDENAMGEEEQYYREHADQRFSHWSFKGVK